MFNLFRYEMRKRRGAMIGWSVGLAVYVIYVIVLFPAIGEEYAAMIENLGMESFLLQMFGDFAAMATFSGYFTVYVADYLPLILAIYAIVNGSGALAGEEEEGTLELLLAQPLARWQIVIAKVAAMALAVFIILLATALVAALTFIGLEEQIGATPVAAADLVVLTLYVWPLVMLFMMLSLFLGAFLPRRRLAAMTVTLLLIASFFGNNLAAVSESLEALQPFFPFYYYDGQAILEQGVAGRELWILMSINVLLLALTLISFQRRDVTVGAWPWQRARTAPR